MSSAMSPGFTKSVIARVVWQRLLLTARNPAVGRYGRAVSKEEGCERRRSVQSPHTNYAHMS